MCRIPGLRLRIIESRDGLNMRAAISRASNSSPKATLEELTPESSTTPTGGVEDSFSGPAMEEGQPERTERRSTRIRQPSKRMMESMNQQPRSRRRKTDGEGHPAQRIWTNLARLAVASELLIDD